MYSFIYLLYSTYATFALGNLTLEFPSFSRNNITGTRPRQGCLTWGWQLVRWPDFLSCTSGVIEHLNPWPRSTVCSHLKYNLVNERKLTVVPPYTVLLGSVSHANRLVDLRMGCRRKNSLVPPSSVRRLILGLFLSWGHLFSVSELLLYLYVPPRM